MEYDVINGYMLDEEFIREYEKKRELKKDYAYGSIYKVIVKINEEGVKAGLLEDLKDHSDTINVESQTVTMILSVLVDEGVHDIEMSFFYTLNAGKYGVLDWECLKTTWTD